MPKCRICDKDVPMGAKGCPACGAPASAATPTIAPELEHELVELIGNGSRLQAVSRYMDATGASLEEADETIQWLQQQSAVPTDLDSQQQQELLDLLSNGQKLQAVKTYRAHHDCTLLEAKEAVEALAAAHGVVSRGGGCLSVVAFLAVALAGSAALSAWLLFSLPSLSA